MVQQGSGARVWVRIEHADTQSQDSVNLLRVFKQLLGAGMIENDGLNFMTPATDRTFMVAEIRTTASLSQLEQIEGATFYHSDYFEWDARQARFLEKTRLEATIDASGPDAWL